MTELLTRLESLRSGGRKLLVPYLMGGFPQADAYPEALSAVAEHADAVEVGLPYSDPLMDGPVIASAGERVIRDGVGPARVLDLTASIEIRVPRIVMTYYNPIHRTGETEFCRRAAEAGFSGLVVPDLPLEESESLRSVAAEYGLAWVGLVAPTSPPERIAAIAGATTGFVYAVSTLGVTGTRDALAASTQPVVAACRAATDLPILVGIGISNAEQARHAAATADGVVVGSAVVRVVLEEGAQAARAFLAEVRGSLDSP
ncbi:MAG: tryptophan synthase subunit alpha [Actinomycetota bacterium]